MLSPHDHDIHLLVVLAEGIEEGLTLEGYAFMEGNRWYSDPLAVFC
jgi:hypothetical protein